MTSETDRPDLCIPTLTNGVENLDEALDFVQRVVMDSADTNDSFDRVDAERLAQSPGVHVPIPNADHVLVDLRDDVAR